MCRITKIVLSFFVICLLCTLSLSCLADEYEKDDVLTINFVSPSLSHNNVRVIEVVCLDDTFYAYLSNSKVYKWDYGETQPQLFCELPQQQEDKIDFIAAGDGELWGVNISSGKVGLMKENTGVQWQSIILDEEQFLAEGTEELLRVSSAFVMNQTLFVFVAFDNDEYPRNNYKILAYDLMNGSCKSFTIDDVQGYCLYNDNSILLHQWHTDGTRTFNVLDIDSGSVIESVYVPPVLNRKDNFGAIAYNAKTRQLFCIGDGKVWTCNADGTCNAISAISYSRILGETPAWMLSNGYYAVFDASLMLRSTASNPNVNVIETLTIKGMNADTIYADFTQDNPNIPVVFSHTSEWLSCNQIANEIISKDNSWDIYCVYADSTFTALKEKGYGTDLSDSRTLTSDIREMYSAVQNTLLTSSGTPIAYPYSLKTAEMKVNLGLWNLVFQEDELPSTYGQFFDSMIIWEEEYSDEFPEIDFVLNFDHVNYIKKVMNAYAQQYGNSDSMLDYSRPELREVLGKLEEVCLIRRANGKPTEFVDNAQLGLSQIFNDTGLNNVLVEQGRPHLTYSSELYYGVDLQESFVMDILSFQPQIEPNIPGKLLVMFINPYSEHKELALSYLEYAAKMENNPRLYYAMHPNQTEPLPNETYERKINSLISQKESLENALKQADDFNKAELQDELNYTEEALANQELYKWSISADTIYTYREIAPSISFFDDNIYIVGIGSDVPEEFEQLFKKYAANSISLDLFIQGYERRMQMMYYEGM